MYTFFTILGILFVITASVLINYIYKIFSINAITNFLHPTNGNRVINEINITVLPIILWSFIELPVLGKNDNFVFAVILNIIVSCAIMYEVKYGLYVVVKLENTFSEVLAIIMASVIGQGVAFMILKSMPFFNFTNFEYLISIISLIAIFIATKNSIPFWIWSLLLSFENIIFFLATSYNIIRSIIIYEEVFIIYNIPI